MTTTRRLAFEIDDGAVSFVDTTLGVGIILTDDISLGRSANAYAAEAHAVKGGTGTGATHNTNPLAGIWRTPITETFSSPGKSPSLPSGLTGLAMIVRCDSSPAGHTFKNIRFIGSSDAGDFATTAHRTVSNRGA